MVALPGRGFDSRQLHKKAITDTPERGCTVSGGRQKSLLLKPHGRKRANMRSMVAVIACIFEAQGSPKVPPPAPLTKQKTSTPERGCAVYDER